MVKRRLMEPVDQWPTMSAYDEHGGTLLLLAAVLIFVVSGIALFW